MWDSSTVCFNDTWREEGFYFQYLSGIEDSKASENRKRGHVGAVQVAF